MHIRNPLLAVTALAVLVLAACTPTPAVTYQLDVTIAGSGDVVSTPEGIDSDAGTLTASFDEGTDVTLEATRDAGYDFTGWSGDACDGLATATCVVTMDDAKSVTATFTATAPATETLTVQVDPEGGSAGSVTSDPVGINTATSTNSFNFDIGDTVELTATTTVGAFAGWSGGDCDGVTDSTCIVTMEAGEPTITATFTDSATLTVDVLAGGSSAGEVTSDPAGIDTATGADSNVFTIGDTVELTATATSGDFYGWSGGDCDGLTATTCTVTIDLGEPTVTAMFNEVISLEIAVADFQDDAVEFLDASLTSAVDYPEGWVWADFPRLDLNFDEDHAPVEVGLRFENVTVPADARLQSARVRFTAQEASTASVFDLTISGQATLDPANFPQDPNGSPSDDITSRTARTTATTAWTVTDAWTLDDPYATPSIAGILEELIGQAGWETSTQSVVLFLSPDDLTSTASRRVYALSDGGAPPAGALPTLLVEYVQMPTP